MKSILTTLLIINVSLISFAQNVGIGTLTPEASAKLEISSSNSGLLIPRMNKAQRNAITTPAQGLLVFQNAPDSVGFYYYNSGRWIWLQNASGAGSGWSTTGNAGTDTSVNFIGTTDDMPLKFKVNNQTGGILDANRGNAAFGAEAYSKYSGHSLYSTAGNVAIGGYALSQDTVGSFNTAVGYHSMKETVSPDGQNTAVGSFSLRYIDGFQNSAFGSSAMEYLNVGNFNTALGAFAYTNKTSGTGNTAVGWGSMSPSIYRPVSGNYNTAVGLASLKNNRSGNGAVAIGHNAAYSDTAAEGVVAIGRAALYNNNGKHGNLAIGDSALYNTGFGATEAEGFDNVGIGSKVLFKNVEGYYNTALGSFALYNNISIGNTAIGTGALESNTFGSMNIGVGPFSLLNNTYGEGNIAMGINSLYNNKTGNYNTAIGHLSMQGNSGPNATSSSNTAIGSFAMSSNSTGNNNTSVGDSSLYKNTTGYSNVAIGTKALFKNTNKSNLVAIGDSALFNNVGFNATTGIKNTAVGSKSLLNNTNGSNNTAFGSASLISNTGGAYNTGIGETALQLSNGNGNVALGSWTLNSLSTGNYNTAIGTFAGNGVEGSNNTIIAADSRFSIFSRNISGSVFLGYEAGNLETTSNKLYIENSNANKDNSLIYGDFAADSLLLNGKTVVRNNAVVRGYTKLGGYGADVPSIKMKELTGTTALTNNGQQPISLGGVDPLKIISVSTLVGIASNAVWLPPSYDSDPRLKYNYFVHTNGNLYIQNNSTDCISAGDHICNKTVKIVITYKE